MPVTRARSERALRTPLAESGRKNRSMMTALARLRTLAACALLATPLAAAGPNLLINPTFDTTVTGWSGIPATWSLVDATGAPRSGSLRFSFPPGNPDETAAQQCIPASPGAYAVRASVYVDGQPDDKTFVIAAFFPTTDCSGPYLDQIFDRSEPGTGWRPLGGSGVAPATTRSAYVVLAGERGDDTSGTTTIYWDDVYFGTGGCADNAHTLCVNHERFQIRAHYTTATQDGEGTAVPFADESGSFWFFSPTNIEIDAKVLDGCALNHRYWVFAAGLTSVNVELDVTDTKTGVVKTYRNPAGHIFTTIADTKAFATCP